MSTATLPPATEFCLRMARVTTALVRRFDSALGSHHGISFSDYQILRHLNLAPGGRLRRVDLAECLGLTASAVTRALLPLEKIGLVGRESDPRDARVGFAIITPVGSELVGNAESVVDIVSANLVGSVRAELAALNAALAQMSANPGAGV